jgi:hypothetical protein
MGLTLAKTFRAEERILVLLMMLSPLSTKEKKFFILARGNHETTYLRQRIHTANQASKVLINLPWTIQGLNLTFKVVQK